jgi:hypothetical protein
VERAPQDSGAMGGQSATDPVESALAAGVAAIAARMSRAGPGDLIALVDRMTVLARELDARRLARRREQRHRDLSEWEVIGRAEPG